MRIVHVIARLNDGGPARVIAALAREMAARGHDSVVLAGACAADEPDCTETVRAHAPVERIPGLRRGLSAFGELRALRGLDRRLRELAPDLVHTHTAKAGALGRLACRRLRLPCLHTYHGHVLHGYFGRAGELAVRLAERAVAGAGWHQALTLSQLRDLRDRARIGRRARWRVLPVPVAPVARARASWQEQLRPKVPTVGFLGRLAAVKDGCLWLETLAALARLMPVQGLVCGDGQERAMLEARARSLAVPILFAGFVPAGEALAVMDLLLVTSRNEGLPLAVFEAGGVGVPVVAPPVGGLADAIRWGAAVGARREPATLAAACARLLGSPRLHAAQARRGAAAAAAVTPAALAPLYERMYRDIVDNA